jgi:archaemetzincin
MSKLLLIITLLFSSCVKEPKQAPLYNSIPKPKSGDWLAEHKERGQSVQEFLQSTRNIPTKTKGTIYLHPLDSGGTLTEEQLGQLIEFTRAYFYLTVKVNSSELPAPLPFRMNDTIKQFATDPILEMEKLILPEDAYCQLAITKTDLYPDENLNYVFGMGAFRARVGVFSFYRYWSINESTFMRRCFKIIAHETGHMFGMAHCTAYHCCMNGANHLAEMSAQPLNLCPQCLEKLQSSVGFDPIQRYLRLRKFYRKMGLTYDALWVEKWLNQNLTR